MKEYIYTPNSYLNPAGLPQSINWQNSLQKFKVKQDSYLKNNTIQTDISYNTNKDSYLTINNQKLNKLFPILSQKGFPFFLNSVNAFPSVGALVNPALMLYNIGSRLYSMKQNPTGLISNALSLYKKFKSWKDWVYYSPYKLQQHKVLGKSLVYGSTDDINYQNINKYIQYDLYDQTGKALFTSLQSWNHNKIKQNQDKNKLNLIVKHMIKRNQQLNKLCNYDQNLGYYNYRRNSYDQIESQRLDPNNLQDKQLVEQQIFKINFPYTKDNKKQFQNNNNSMYKFVQSWKTDIMESDKYLKLLEEDKTLNLIKFHIYNVITKKFMVAPFFLSGTVQDDISPSWQQISYVGQMYPRANYKGTGFRSISFTLKLLCPSIFYIDQYVHKLNFIKSLILPQWLNKDQIYLPKAPICKMTLGDIVFDKYGYFEEASIKFQQEEAIWNFKNQKADIDIAQNLNIQIPLIVDIDFKFNILYSTAPDFQFYKINNINDIEQFKQSQGE